MTRWIRAMGAASAVVCLATSVSCSSDSESSEAATEASVGEPTTADDVSTGPDTAEQTEPTKNEPEPRATEPGTSAPETTRPVTRGPSTTGPATTDAKTTKPVATTKPGTTEPGATAPARTEPETTKPVATEPDTTKPNTTKPSATDEGTIHDVVPAEEQTTVPSVPLAETAQFGGSISAEVTSVEPIEGEARLPGEVAGPALAVRVRLDNDSSRQVDVSGVTVTLEDADGNPSEQLSSAPAEPFVGMIQPGTTADAVYVFGFENSRSQPITIGVNYSADEPVALFVGNV